jgi:hypothetical protein
MSKRVLALFLIGMVSLAGLTFGQGPPDNEEPPVRLKKKSRGDEKPKVDPDKADEKKKDEKKDEKKEDKKAEPREAEPVTPQEEEKEVLQRVVTNVQRVGERLAKDDLGEATQQTQRDILKDLDSLIHRNENPPPQGRQQNQNQGGGGGGSDNQDNKNQQGGGQQNQKQQGGGQSSKGQSKGGQKSQMGGGGARSGTKPGGGSKSGSQQQQRGGSKGGEEKRAGNDEKAGEKPGGKNGKNGNGGGGGDKDDRARNKNADLDKHGVWGHLPQTLRAQMDAYSNPQPFMPKYDDLIKRYYRTISEQGRRKGE